MSTQMLTDHYTKAIREAIGCLEPGPATCCKCDGCRAEWDMALRTLREALKPVGFMQIQGGAWEKMTTL